MRTGYFSMMNMDDGRLIDNRTGRQAGASGMARAGGTPRVLIVEDEAVISMLLAEVLQEMGYEICATATTEDAAVAAAIQYNPDLMIVDEWLRRGSGVSAMTKINRSIHIPYVFVTGDPLIGRSLSPDTIAIQKPFTIPELVRAVKSALKRTDSGGHLPNPA